MYKKALAHFKKNDPFLHEAGIRIETLTLSVHPDPFLRLCRSVVGQQLSVKAAQTIFERFEKLFKKGVNPADLIEIQNDDLRACGISYTKISYLKDLAQKVLAQELNLDELQNFSNKKVIDTLVKVKGIGVWTAEMFLMFSLGREDVFSYGDLGLRNAIKKLYKLKQKPTQRQIEKLTKKWAPYRTYAAMILWRSLNF